MSLNNKSSFRTLKKTILEMLRRQDIDSALEMTSEIPRLRLINALFPSLYHKDRIVKWKAVTLMGIFVSYLAGENMEAARNVIRRLMWNLNDESGGIGWGSPEAMGEILASQEVLAGEYHSILLSYAREDGNYQENEVIQRGVLWGIGRLTQSKPFYTKDAVPFIIHYLVSTDASVRGHSAWILGLLKVKKAISELEKLIYDEAPMEHYRDRNHFDMQVKDLAKEALKQIGSY